MHFVRHGLAARLLFSVVPVLIALAASLAANTSAQAMADSNTILRANPSPADYGQTVTLTATVNAGVNGAFSGTVEFFDGATSLNPGGTAIISVSPVTSISINEDHACVTGGAGDVANGTFRSTANCWGDNTYGQIGDGSNIFRATPTPANDLNGILGVAAGFRFTCVMTPGNGVACWGDNRHNQLGQGSSNLSESAPVAVTGASSGVAAIASGGFHSCAISAANVTDTSGGGAVLCWGENGYGQLGNTTPNTTSAAVVAVSGINNAIAIAAGYQHSCALLTDGTVKCWGHNGFGQIGSGAPVNDLIHATPVTVPGITNAVAIASTKNHVCAVLLDGTAKCWGANDRKQLGDGNGGGASDKSATPVTVLNVSDAMAVAAGYAHSCVVRSNGVASCWGDNQFGQMGNSASSASPQDIANVTGLTAGSIVAGGYSTCAITQAAGLQCWGHNVGNLSAQNAPTDVSNPFATLIAVPGQARISVSSLKADTHTITAKFTPTANDIAPSDSNSVSLFVRGLTSITTISANANPGLIGNDVTFTVNVSGDNGPGGTGFSVLTLKVDGNSVDFQNVVSGAATLTATGLTQGTHTVQAFFSGDDVYSNSQSGIVNQVVKGATTLALSATPGAAKSGQSVALTATLSLMAPATGAPTGSVSFKDGAVAIGSVPLASGQAHLSKALKVGSHTVTATYAGDGDFFGGNKTASVTVTATVGGEMSVATAAKAQQFPAAARLKSGYLIAWASSAQDGAGYGVYARRYSASGIAAGGEIHVSTATAGDQTLPAAAGFSDGTFIIMWQSPGQDGSGIGIIGQRFSATGTKLGVEIKINTTTAGDQTQPAVAVLSNNDFLVTWTSKAQDGSGLGVYAKRFKSTGVAVGAEFKVNKTTVGDQSNSSVAPLGTGFIVTWQGPDASGIGILAQRFDANSKPVGNELKVNSFTVGAQTLPKVTALKTGTFVVTWQSVGQDGAGLGVYMQQYTATGTQMSGNKRVATTTAGDQGAPAISAFTDKGFVVTWTSPDGSGLGVYTQAFNDTGVAVDAEFRVNTVLIGLQNQPSVAAFAQGNFVTAWTGPDASGTGILAQRLQVPVP
jgi:alpha-tubulin suppressor-like RCC1 family protein